MHKLIPDSLFVDLSYLWLVVIGLAAMYVLLKAADFLVEGATGIATKMGMSKVIVGATIVSLGTTSPEAAVSVTAAFDGNAGVALGNAIGSIIADSALIFGVCCCMMVLPADKFVLKRQGWIQLGSAIVLAIICYMSYFLMGPKAGTGGILNKLFGEPGAPVVGRLVGFAMLAGLAWYMWISVRWGRQHAKLFPEAEESEADEIIAKAAKDTIFKSCMYMAGGLVLVLLSGRVVIACVMVIAQRVGIPEIVLASTIVAFGTSLPELVVGITAVRKGHGELLVGNIIGADILNVLFVVGAAASAKSLPILGAADSAYPSMFLWYQIPVMLIVLIVFRIFIGKAMKAGQFSKWMGYPLVAMYIAYIAGSIFLGVPTGH